MSLLPWTRSRQMASLAAVTAFFLSAAAPRADEPAAWPLLLHETFDDGANRWEPTDPGAWKIEHDGDRAIYRQFKASQYEPPHRSPFNVALLKDVYVTDFVLEARVRSTSREYPHRDMCFIFGWRDPAHFYYVHLGKRADDHANQVFIVNDAPRTKISTRSTPGTPWTNDWHDVKIVRHSSEGTIEVYFDDMHKPVMTARDRSFPVGRVGVGTFDDTGDFDIVTLRGQTALRPH